jgi:hypothetical protein
MMIVQPTSQVVARYQHLLTADWTANLPQEVLSLLWTTLADHVPDEADSLLQLLDPDRNGTFPTTYFQSVAARIATGAKLVRFSGLPDLPTEYVPATKLAKIAWQGNRLATYLTLPAHATVSGETGFLVDVLALAFQATIHFVLPKLRKSHPAEHALLLNAAELFAIGYAAHDFGHYAYMMSMIHGYLGNEDEQLRSLYASFQFTSPQDHSYLTKAQEIWMELLDRKKYIEAEDFLFSLRGSAPASQQQEVHDMIVDAFDVMRSSP